ncbi:MAG: S-methyl-5-thioribose-1-phosphate isomerase [Myxococcota bacterium]|nr:S-methyl-5-thioribose-1-phosphate isomerase [Myxococcota bacterium]MDW8363164.1 S-methyl-5-thioribose-1-phosphate isomerase [Myxococcales bacterium]
MSATRARLSRPPLSGSEWFAVELDPDEGTVVVLDQRRLPDEEHYERLRSPDEVRRAIADMVVRGAPAIGIAAAYALVLQARAERGDARAFLLAMGIAGRMLAAARPTAVNLQWAVARMARVAAEVAHRPPAVRAERIQLEAEAIHREDVAACRAIGVLGAADLPDGAVVLTHCNAGALATGGYGTALGVVRAARDAGKRVRVLATETRPYLQGARLTAWELQRDGIEVEVVPDGAAAVVLAAGEVHRVLVGADRVARNGDVANKVGTYGLAVLARAHEVPFAVAAPTSTLDMATPTGADIPIEQRSREEIALVAGRRIVPDGVPCRHPAFDVTPARLIDVLYTERGALRPARGETPETLRRK